LRGSISRRNNPQRLTMYSTEKEYIANGYYHC
jgi:hypothetical protein